MGGFDKLQFLGRFRHLPARLLDGLFQLFAVHILYNRVGGEEWRWFYIRIRLALRLLLFAQNGDAVLDDLLRCDTVFLVVIHLFFASSIGLFDGEAHAFGDFIGIENYLTMDITGGAASGLGQRTVRPQKALFIRIEDGHERNFRQVQSFAQEVDTDEDVEQPFAQIVHDLHTFQGIHVAVDVVATDAHAGHVSR